MNTFFILMKKIIIKFYSFKLISRFCKIFDHDRFGKCNICYFLFCDFPNKVLNITKKIIIFEFSSFLNKGQSI